MICIYEGTYHQDVDQHLQDVRLATQRAGITAQAAYGVMFRKKGKRLTVYSPEQE